MLNKEICKKCIKEWSKDYGGRPWLKEDERCWKNGAVCCPPNFVKPSETKTDKPPPPNCPYRMEQILSNAK